MCHEWSKKATFFSSRDVAGFPPLFRPDALQAHPALPDHALLDLPAAPASARQPCRHGAPIHAKGRDDGLERTARAQRGEDDGHQIGCGPQPIEGHALGGSAGLAAV